jgi:PRC-barrel domain
MSKKLALVSAIAMLAVAPAMAQNTAVPSTSSAVSTSKSSQIDADKLIGRSIQPTADKATIGKIDSVVLSSSGRVDKVIVGVGGFLGVGKKDVAISWNDLNVADNGKDVSMNTTKARLEAMPEYVWPKDQKHGAVYSAGASAPATTNSGSAGTAPTTTGTSDTSTHR